MRVAKAITSGDSGVGWGMGGGAMLGGWGCHVGWVGTCGV